MPTRTSNSSFVHAATALLCFAALDSAPARAGVTATGNQVWRQGATDVFGTLAGSPLPGEYFGYTAATGDFRAFSIASRTRPPACGAR